MNTKVPNLDQATIDSFGDEWTRYDQSELSHAESIRYFNSYFSVFPWHLIDHNSEGFDMGCGSGRWAKHISPKVKKLNCVEPSEAINVAKKNLVDFTNIDFYKGTIDNPKIPDSSQDFGYCLGVLHHVPDTQEAIKSCAKLLKPGAPLLLYLYYSFENRPIIFRWTWKISNYFRLFFCKLSPTIKQYFSELIAIIVYMPLARLSLILEKMNLDVSNIPLSFYRRSSFLTLKTDARDRFGTPLEKRFSRKEITRMCIDAGLSNVIFSDKEPFWCVVSTKI